MFFTKLEGEGYFDGSDIDKSCLQFIYMDIIRSHIHTFIEVHNSHRISRQRKRDHYLPTGQPFALYYYPESGIRDYSEPVNIDLLSRLEEEVQDYDLDEYLPLNTIELYKRLLTSGGYATEFAYSAPDHCEAYKFLRTAVWNFIRDGSEINIFTQPTGAAEWINSHVRHSNMIEIDHHRHLINGDMDMRIDSTDSDNDGIGIIF